MNVVMSEKDGSVVVRLKEERLDAFIADDFKSELKRLYESGKNDVLIDMEDVRFIDSSGLGVFVSIQRVANVHHGSLRLAGVRSQVESMFELTRLNRMLHIVPALDEKARLGRKSRPRTRH